jgi:hypothetical protein
VDDARGDLVSGRQWRSAREFGVAESVKGELRFPYLLPVAAQDIRVGCCSGTKRAGGELAALEDLSVAESQGGPAWP